MKEFVSADLTRRTGDVLSEASRNPIGITRYGKRRFVVMTVEHYDEMTGASEATVHETMDGESVRVLKMSLSVTDGSDQKERMASAQRAMRSALAAPSLLTASVIEGAAQLASVEENGQRSFATKDMPQDLRALWDKGMSEREIAGAEETVND